MIPYGDYPDHTAINRVLVIKLRHHGDVLLATPVFSCLRTALPGVVIDALIYAETKPMLVGNPWLETIHLYDSAWKSATFSERICREIGLITRLRACRYDMVINLTEGDRGAIVAMLSGARIRVGWNPEKQGFYGRRWCYTHLIKHCRKPRHMVEQNLDCLRRIGIFPVENARNLHLSIPEESKRAVAQRLHQAGIKPGQAVVIHPTSRWLFKCWPLENTIELIRKILAHGYPIVLTAAPDAAELALITRIVAACGSDGIDNWAGSLSLKELAALIQQARCLLTIDSVPMHIASCLKKPTLALFGPSSELIWGPWKNPEAHCLVSPYHCRPCGLDGCGGGKVSDCLAALSVDQVWRRFIEMVAIGDRGH
ncbi:MAG: putative lipopolysaccharide heptosyltransferase III [Desulfobulbaceae bacterium]|nr:putative lipopolysaccharide heptosyltransferase III [Desulfobulbaceae bacterium]